MTTAQPAPRKGKHALRGADKKEAFHREAESRVKLFACHDGDAIPEQATKLIRHLAHTDLLQASIQVIPEGGDNNLHYHPGADGLWMSLKGRARFYGPDGLTGEFGPNEGILVPRNARYWFETADPKEVLHLLHVTAHTTPKPKNKRINVDAPKRGNLNALRLDAPD